MSDDKALIKTEQNMVAEITPFQARSNELLAKAKKQKVTNEKTVADAVALKKQITAHRTLVNQSRLGITRKIDSLKKAIMSKESEVLQPLEEAQNNVGEKILHYQEEQERKRREEQEHIDKNIARVSAGNVYTLRTVDEVNTKGESIKSVYRSMSADDQKNPLIKAAFTESVNKLTDRKNYLVEQAQREAERAELDKKAAEQAARDRRLREREEKLKREEEQAELERKAAEAKRAKELEEKNAVKTGARTVTTIEITHSHQVPRQYCVPSEPLIRAAVKEGVIVPGVKVTKVKKV